MRKVLALLFLVSSAATAQVAVKNLPAGSAIADANLTICDQSSTTYNCPFSAVATYIAGKSLTYTGTNLVGTGGSLATSGSGTITANVIQGTQVTPGPASGGDTTSISLGTGAYTNSVATNGWNVAIGFNAMNGSTACVGGSGSGFDVAIGWQALKVDAGCENTALGVNTLLVNTSGSFNIAIGNDAVSANTTGSSNIGIGHTACGTETSGALTGSGNICLGNGSGGFISGAATDNISIGFNAGQGTLANQFTGTYNVAIGWSAMQNVTTSTSNVAVGFGALEGVSATPLTGAQNTAVGYQALQTSQGSGAHNNTAVGYDALSVLTTGNYDTAVGDTAGLAVTTGYFNSFFGRGAGNKLTTGYSNTIIGLGVASTTLTTGNTNILIGNSSATDTVASGTANEVNIGGVFMGYATAPTVTSGGGTSPTVTGSGTFLFVITEGATGTPSATLVLAMPTAPTDWACDALDRTSSSITARQSGAASTTAATITFSSAPANSDVIQIKCLMR